MGKSPKSWSEFGQSSTIHGVSYALGLDRGHLERGIWSVLVLSAGVASFWGSLQMYRDMDSNPTMTMIESTSLPIDQIPFPVINICRPGYTMGALEKDGIDVSSIHHWSEDFSPELFATQMTGRLESLLAFKFMLNQTNLSYSPLLNESFKEARSEFGTDLQAHYQRLVGKMFKDERNFESIMNLILQTNLDCHEFIRSCRWNGEPFSCRRLFHSVSTDLGLCCSFHFDRDSLRPGVPLEQVVRPFYKVGDLYFGTGHHLGMDMRPKTGRDMGLQLILDGLAFKNDRSSVSGDFNGFEASVSAQSESVTIGSNGFLIAPGHETRVTLSAVKIDTDEAFKEAIKPAKRKCLFNDELQLKLFQEYSKAKCQMECATLWAYDLLKCTPWSVPGLGRIICDLYEAKRFYQLAEERFSNGTQCSHCLSDCEEVVYDVRTSSAQFRRCDHQNMGNSILCNFTSSIQPPKWGQLAIQELGEEVAQQLNISSSKRHFSSDKIFRSALNGSEANEYEAYEKDIALVRFVFGKQTVTQFKRYVRITDADLVSQIGGIFGICLGCSALSLFEIAYWLLTQLCAVLKSKVFHHVEAIWS